MTSRPRIQSSVFYLVNLMAVAFCLASPAALTQEEGEKGIKSEEVVNRQKKTRSAGESRKAKTYTSNIKRPTTPTLEGEEDVRFGVTIFRYEPRGAVYSAGEDGTKDIFMEGTEETPTPPTKVADWNIADWTRATSDEQFAVGQVIRLHFEPLTRAGYLYVVHQELYANNVTGPAHLLFPTRRTNNGNNLVQPSVDLWVPRAPAYFRIHPSKSHKTHIGELVTVVLRAESPEKILRRAIENKPLLLAADERKRLLMETKDAIIRMNLDGGEGERQTTRELSKDIAMEGNEALTDDDPLPQTVYETRQRVGQPVVFRIPLKFKGK